ncbi:hypothetical protein TPAR_00874 [Tolypocladium paradoxum]|uniref:Uncharacterized protein n=1 Tax=Tolypocladium paradoxum TaxID=94208 RepID=A0A2S4L901_9HYPO|nr:hypothetical protein TPAR_00874 [Tolypocladium paradoxum]
MALGGFHCGCSSQGSCPLLRPRRGTDSSPRPDASQPIRGATLYHLHLPPQLARRLLALLISCDGRPRRASLDLTVPTLADAPAPRPRAHLSAPPPSKVASAARPVDGLPPSPTGTPWLGHSRSLFLIASAQAAPLLTHGLRMQIHNASRLKV